LRSETHKKPAIRTRHPGEVLTLKVKTATKGYQILPYHPQLHIADVDPDSKPQLHLPKISVDTFRKKKKEYSDASTEVYKSLTNYNNKIRDLKDRAPRIPRDPAILSVLVYDL